jgi:hypothetical protein
MGLRPQKTHSTVRSGRHRRLHRGEALMRSCCGIARVVLLAGLAVALCNSAAQAGTRIRLAQSSNVTNCMMRCNSQAAICQTTCLVPGSQPTGAATTGGNATKSTSCQLNCTTQQVSCQTICAQNSPSQ